MEFFNDKTFAAKYQQSLNWSDAGHKVEPIPMIDYCAFIDAQWHKTVLWVCEMIERYTMTELWAMDIVRFTKLTFEARSIQAEKRKQAMAQRS